MDSFGANGNVATSADIIAEIDEEVAADAEEEFETPLDRLLGIVETKLLNGRHDTGVSKWLCHLGLPEQVANEMIRQVRIGWQSVHQDYETYCSRRDLARARLNKIYEMAMNKGDLKNATGAVKHLIDLDGLEAPKTLNINTSAQSHQITNASRQTVAQLIERMKTLAESRKIVRLQARGIAGQKATKALEIIELRERPPSNEPEGDE